MKVTKAFVGLAAVAAALTLTPMTGAQAAGAACSPGGELTHMFKAAGCPSQSYTDKREYAPGETIRVNVPYDKKCGTYDVTSEGFAVKAKVSQVETDGTFWLRGETRAITTPGAYMVTIDCDKVLYGDMFTIKAPTTTKPPAPGKPKPPITKPKGAADTGGGGTA